MNREDYRKAMDSLTFSADFAERTAALLREQTRQQEKETVMNWNKRKKTALLAAAVAAALAVSVSAANLDALKEIVWEIQTAFFVSGETEDGSFAAIRVPKVRLFDREDRVLLSVEGEETDITDALNAEQFYTVELAEEAGRLVIEVTGTPEDCTCAVSGYGRDEEEPVFTVSFAKNGEYEDPAFDVTYDAPNGEAVASDETVIVSGSAYGDRQTVTVTKDDEFAVGHYGGDGVYGLDTDDPLT